MKIFVDMDGVLCDFNKAYQAETALKFPQSKQGFFLNLDPLPGAIEALNTLAEEHEVFILTAPSTHNPHCWTEKAQWIEKWLGFDWLSRVIITERKDLLASRDSWLIDDMDSGKGQEAWVDVDRLIMFGTYFYALDWPSTVKFISLIR